jgi:hypothetical protein
MNSHNSGRTGDRSPSQTVPLCHILCLFVAVGTCLPNRCPTVDYSASIRCRGNVLTEPLPSNGHIRNNNVMFRGCVLLIKRILDWMIGFIDTLYIELGTKRNYSATAISILYNSPLHKHYGAQSSLVVTWQRITVPLSLQITHEVFFS